MYNAGPITDYAANAMVVGSLMQTIPGVTAYYGGPPFQNTFNYTIQKLTDGSSNTVLLGIKALATNSYSQRGQEYVTLSNGAQTSADDEPIANSGIGMDVDGGWDGCFGLLRGHCPDTLAWFSGPLNTSQPDVTYIPGNKFGIGASSQSWFQYTFQIVPDNAIDPGAGLFNRWGSAYAGGSLFAMADGSVHMAAYSTPYTIVIAMCTPFGGEPYTPPW